MAFAFGYETHARVINALADLSPFTSSLRKGIRHGLVGLRGPYRQLTNVRYGALPMQYTGGLNDAEYVVYAYGTPIAWVNTTVDGRRVNYLPDWQYSATTTYYQNLVRRAWGGKIVDPNSWYSWYHNRGTKRGRTSDERYEGRVLREWEPRSPSDMAIARQVQIEDIVWSPENDPLVPRHEDAAEEILTNRAVLLDPRYADPDWVPRRNRVMIDWSRETSERPGESKAHP